MKADRLLRVAVLCSRRAPGLAHLVERDPNRSLLYEIVCALTSELECPELEPAQREQIACIVHPIRPFYGKWRAPLGDLRLRAEYDQKTFEILSAFRPDLVVLAGYLYILTSPMLSGFPERILNVHHSDLTLKGPSGPRYVGLRSVRDAILAGERETRATVHLVNAGLDDGPLLLRSWPFPVAPLVRDGRAWGANDMLKAYAFAHQEWMLRSAWGPLLARSIELVATGRARFTADRAWIDGVPGPWGVRPSTDGSTILESPRRCLAPAVGAWGS